MSKKILENTQNQTGITGVKTWEFIPPHSIGLSTYWWNCRINWSYRECHMTNIDLNYYYLFQSNQILDWMLRIFLNFKYFELVQDKLSYAKYLANFRHCRAVTYWIQPYLGLYGPLWNYSNFSVEITAVLKLQQCQNYSKFFTANFL